MTSFRKYPMDPNSSIYQHYYNKNTQQTLEFILAKEQEYHTRCKFPLVITEALNLLNTYQDPSDPDTDQDNLLHAYQTAERIRQDYPNEEWLQITGLIHDVGKILFSTQFKQPDWCVVGDIFPVGCQFSEQCVYSEFFKVNPDNHKYDQLGIYSLHCGLDNLHMTWGHDYYLYKVLIDNKDRHSLPDLALRIIRYHSFYPLHHQGAYSYFLNQEQDDLNLLLWLQKFSTYDLYSKKDPLLVTNDIKSYYHNLLTKYFHEELLW